MRKMIAGSCRFGMIACCVALGLLASPAVEAQDGTASADKWQFEITPYLFASGLNGTAGVQGVEGNINMGFNDIWNHLDKAFMGLFEARKGPWAFLLDGIYTKLEDEQTKSVTGPVGVVTANTDFNATVTMTIYQPTFGYRLVDERTKWDVLLGSRYTQLDSSLNAGISIPSVPFSGGRSASGSVTWWDTVVGARVIAPIADRWSFVGYADVGTNSTYQVLAGVNWQFAEQFSGKFGYRFLHQDYESGGTKWDMDLQGAYMGLGIRF
jgi:opacity protein-like surface antigen